MQKIFDIRPQASFASSNSKDKIGEANNSRKFELGQLRVFEGGQDYVHRALHEFSPMVETIRQMA